MRRTGRRIIAALMGGLLLAVVVVEGYFQSVGFYKEHYIIPKQKYGVLTPLRWQDVVFLLVFWALAVLLLAVSYLLLRYAFQGRPVADTSGRSG